MNHGENPVINKVDEQGGAQNNPIGGSDHDHPNIVESQYDERAPQQQRV